MLLSPNKCWKRWLSLQPSQPLILLSGLLRQQVERSVRSSHTAQRTEESFRKYYSKLSKSQEELDYTITTAACTQLEKTRTAKYTLSYSEYSRPYICLACISSTMSTQAQINKPSRIYFNLPSLCDYLVSLAHVVTNSRQFLSELTKFESYFPMRENCYVKWFGEHHPSTGTLFWAHHEKWVVIDQLCALVRGVDLCFGLWDEDQHLLTDSGSVQLNQQHAFNQDTSLASELRALVKAPLTLSLLGLEEEGEVVVRTKFGKPAYDSNDNTRSSRQSDHVEIVQGDDGGVPRRIGSDRQVTSITCGADRHDEIDSGIKQPRTPTTPNMQEEVVFTDKETGGVRVKIWRRASKYVPAKYRHSTPPIMTTQVPEDQSSSATEKGITRIPLEVLEEAGPAPSMFEKATKSGMDMATAAEKYKEYVSSGAEKHRAQTPPPKRKESRLPRAVVNWRSNRAKKKWRQLSTIYKVVNTFLCHCVSSSPRSDGSEQSWEGPSITVPGIKWVLDSHEVTAGYELNWLRLQKAGQDDVRMPWHNIHSLTVGVPARDVAKHFIQQWNATEKLKDDINYPYLLSKTYENLKVRRVFKSEAFSEQVNIQVLRSLFNWSGLINTTEDSIQMAYLSLIANSKHYIYIENQFFVSMIDSPDVLNEVCKVICNRIIRASKEKQKYRVYIMIPLLPGFEGDVGAPGGSSLQAVLHWTYLSLSRGPNSLIERLKAEVG